MKKKGNTADSLEALEEIVTHALLHLEFKRKASPRPLTIKESNKLLINWLSLKIKHKKYRFCEVEIKDALKRAKRKNEYLEHMLLKMNQINQNTRKALQESDLLFIFFNGMNKHHNYTSAIAYPKVEQENGVIYMNDKDFENVHDEKGNLNTPIKIFINGVEKEAFLSAINTQSAFTIQKSRKTGEKLTVWLDLKNRDNKK